MPSAPLPPPRAPGEPYRVCLVCLGNICRSPMAEVVLRDGLARAGLDGAVEVDSAGTGDWHIGGPMSVGARAALARHGYDGSAHRARQVKQSWLAQRDLLLAMDSGNLAALRRLARAPDDSRIRLFAEVADGAGDIPDPYGGGAADYDHALDLIAAHIPVIVDRLARLLAPDPDPDPRDARPGGPGPGGGGADRPCGRGVGGRGADRPGGRGVGGPGGAGPGDRP